MKYLAFDFGDGTTTVASCGSEKAGEVKVENIVSGKKEIPTIMGFREDGECVIGYSAINDRECKLCSNWKTRPSKISDENRRFTVCYMREVFETFLRTNPSWQNNDYKIYIGVPSDWSDEDIVLYRQMAEEAGIPNVGVLRESQAAVLFAKKFMRLPNGKLLGANAIKNGLLLIDVGSSTTDFTYLKGMSAWHCGYDLGAKYIDNIILQSALEKQDSDKKGRFVYREERDENGKIKQDPNKVSHAFKCREFKEQYFSSDSLDSYGALEFRVAGLKSVDKDDKYTFTFGNDDEIITKDYIDSLLDNVTDSSYTFVLPNHESKEKRSWRAHFRYIIKEAVERLNIDTSTLSVVVTGGATRMYFIEEDVKEILGDDKEIFFGDDNLRSFSVVKGLAWAAYAEDCINEVRKNLHDKIYSDCAYAVEDFIKDKIFMPIAEEIAKSVKSSLCWDLDNKRSCVSTLRKLIDKESEYIVSELNSALKKINDGSYGITPILSFSEVSGITSALYGKFSKPGLTFDEKLTSVFSWNWSKAVTSVVYFRDQIMNKPSSLDEEFSEDGIFFESHYNVASNDVRNQLDKYKIMEIFEKDDARDSFTGKVLESDVSRLKNCVLKKLEEYKLHELDALAGHYKYTESV